MPLNTGLTISIIEVLDLNINIVWSVQILCSINRFFLRKIIQFDTSLMQSWKYVVVLTA
jgi:hypothetical protein